MEDSVGRQYVLRSVDKEPAVGLPERLQESYIAFVARDATSATHPYAALTLPPMARAIGIYHTRPELVYMPHGQDLGEYQETFAGMVAMLERRPDEDQTDADRFGNSENVKSTRSMLEDRFRDNDTEVDAEFFLRSRLFDMLLGDWSRHEGNWRWAEFGLEKGVKYKAVPRDRDNVFYKLNDALVPMLFMATKQKEHFRTFRSSIRNVEALNRSGRNLDELLLAGLPREAWLNEARTVKALLTDEVIEKAFQELPDTVYALTADRIIEKLKSRRDQLPKVAEAYYKSLSREVAIVGSDKHEEFAVEFLNESRVEVKAYKLKDGAREKAVFRRVFDPEETKQLNIYGLDGEDRFLFSGEGASQIRIRVFGGAGEDRYAIRKGLDTKGKVHIHDSTYGNVYPDGGKAKVRKNNNPPAQTLDANGMLLKYYLD